MVADEQQAKALSADERLSMHQRAAAKVWGSLDAWLSSEAASRVLPKSKFSQALGDLRNH